MICQSSSTEESLPDGRKSLHLVLRLGSRSCTLALLLLSLLMSAAPANAHQRLIRSEPAAGEHLASAPAVLHLVFAEPLELAFTTVELFDANGNPASLGDPAHGSAFPTELTIPIFSPLEPGKYVVRWSTTSADGHPVRGEFSFTLAAGAPNDAANLNLAAPSSTDPLSRDTSAAAAGTGQDDLGAEAAGTFDAGSTAYVAIRWAAYVALLLVIGSLVFSTLVVTSAARQAGSAGELVAPGALRSASGVGLIAVTILILTSIARLLAQTAAVFGVDSVSDLARLQVVALASGWGNGWLVHLAGAVGILIALLLARTGRRGAWYLALLMLPVLLLGQALTGHAAAVQGRFAAFALAADSLHLLGAGGWMGTLALLLLAGLPAAARLGAARRSGAVADLVRAFSPVALLFAALLILSGLIIAALHVGSLDALIQTRYGRILAIKLGLFVPLLAVGAYNFLAVRPALGSTPATSRLRRSATVEIAVASLIVLVTAVLVSTSRP